MPDLFYKASLANPELNIKNNNAQGQVKDFVLKIL